MPRYVPPHLEADARHETVALVAPMDRALRIAVIADTHSHPHPQSVELVAGHAPDCILHAGDIGDRSVIRTFEAIAPVHAVRGNIDERSRRAPADSVSIEVDDDDGPLLRAVLVHIAVQGPRLRADAARFAAARGASMVVCGHSHVPFIGRDRGMVVFNPGSIGPRRFALPITFGMLTVARAGIDLHHVSCETGARWLPG